MQERVAKALAALWPEGVKAEQYGALLGVAKELGALAMYPEFSASVKQSAQPETPKTNGKNGHTAPVAKFRSGTQLERVMATLKKGPATRDTLQQAAGKGATSLIWVLRQKGVRIQTRQTGPKEFVYELKK